MEVKKGIVTSVRNTLEVSGGGENGSASTTHISLFKIDMQPVKVKSSEPPVIDENDYVAVAGKLSKGVFEAYAYNNISNGVSGNRGIGIFLLFGLIFPFAGISSFITFSDPFFGWLPKVVSSFFVCVGVYLFYYGTQVMRAENLIKSVSKP